jgi:hypothetical protein
MPAFASFVLDALFDHFQQISSNAEITGSLVQCSPISANGKTGAPDKNEDENSCVILITR